MKKIFILSILLLAALPSAAQRGNITTDIFGDLQFAASDLRYSASLKKDIFDNLTFTDNRRNRIVFEGKYLKMEYPAVLTDAGAKIDFFRSIVSRHRRDEGYEARFSVDIFGAVITQDNRGNRTEEKTDIFGGKSYEETRNGMAMSIKRDVHGVLQYRFGSSTASLGKSAFTRGKWVYEDSEGNRFEFGDKTWGKMLRRWGDDERILMFLVDELLLD